MTRASISFADSDFPKSLGITPLAYPFAITLFGSTIDSLMYAAGSSPAFSASAATLSRFGPIAPFEFAGVNA